jgi:hypothetical protein
MEHECSASSIIVKRKDFWQDEDDKLYWLRSGSGLIYLIEFCPFCGHCLKQAPPEEDFPEEVEIESL